MQKTGLERHRALSLHTVYWSHTLIWDLWSEGTSLYKDLLTSSAYIDRDRNTAYVRARDTPVSTAGSSGGLGGEEDKGYRF